MQRYILVILALWLANTGLAQSSFNAENAGAWQGVGVQADGQNWSIDLVVLPQTIGVDYYSIPCAGDWLPNVETRARVLVIEQIKTGKDLCIDGSFVVLQTHDSRLVARWYDASATVYALAILQRNTPKIGDYDTQLAITRNAIAQATAIDPPSTALVRQLFGF